MAYTKSRYAKIVPFNWQTARKSATSFCFAPIYDSLISTHPLVPLVLNKAETRENGTGGKRQGFGIPGGGVNPEWMDSLSGAAKREMEDETGLTVSKISTVPLIEEPQLIISDRKTEERIGQPIRYEKGKEPPVKIDAHNHTAICNPVYTFAGEVVWGGSQLQKIMHKIKNEWLEGSGNEEEVDQFTQECGIYFLLGDLTDEEVTNLAIIEQHEIDGFGLFPLPMLIGMLEDRHPYFEDLYFYYTHLKRVKECATKLKLIPTPVVGGAN